MKEAAAPSASAADMGGSMKSESMKAAPADAMKDSGAAMAPKHAAKPAMKAAHKGEGGSRLATDKASDALRKEQIERLAQKQGGGAAAPAAAPAAPAAMTSDK